MESEKIYKISLYDKAGAKAHDLTISGREFFELMKVNDNSEELRLDISIVGKGGCVGVGIVDIGRIEFKSKTICRK